MSVEISDVLKHIVEVVHFGSEEMRKEALEAIEKEYDSGRKLSVQATGTVEPKEDK
jgi:hypothetical protein